MTAADISLDMLSDQALQTEKGNTDEDLTLLCILAAILRTTTIAMLHYKDCDLFQDSYVTAKCFSCCIRRGYEINLYLNKLNVVHLLNMRRKQQSKHYIYKKLNSCNKLQIIPIVYNETRVLTISV